MFRLLVDNSHDGSGPTQGLHLKLITPVKTLFPNAVTFRGTSG